MTIEIALVFVLLLATFVAMATEQLSPDMVALLALGILLGTEILTPAEAFRVFSNEAAIAVGCMFILSAALERTGALDQLGATVDKLVGKSDWSILIVLLPLVAFTSAFVNNTPVVLIFLPIVTSIATKRGIKPSKLLIPLSFASILGGCCTLIGTSTNLLVSSTAASLGQAGLRMFDLAPVGLVIAFIGMAYLLTVGRHLLAGRDTLAAILKSTDSKKYRTEFVILEDSPLAGKPLIETPLKYLPNGRILDVIRRHESLPLSLDEITLQAGDRIRLSIVLSSVIEIKNLKGIEILQQPDDIGLALVETEKAVVVEGIISPQSRLERNTIRHLDLRRRYGIRVLALHRRGVNLKKKFEDTPLRFGDTLLIEGTESSIKRLQDSRNILVLSAEPHRAPRRSKQKYAAAAMGSIVLLATVTSIPISMLALIAAIFVVMTGCLENDEAYQAIDWRIMFMIFGMLSLGLALEKTGGVTLIVNALLDVRGSFGPPVMLSAVIFVCSFLTTFLSNNAVAVMITPIVVQIATSLQVDTKPFLIGVAIGCSACFATPIGYQTNTLVYGAGGYKFSDFVKVGIPLNLLVWIVASAFIPLLYPLSKH
ncbi:MAG: putative transporter [Verrucomicrobia subdivision 3 bacterium]|nr:putative transporter [Limisphaerales bacterium]MCS1412470.1 putative transporter [Limisphaerales bacterium]